jgi:hypothetical protein
VKDEWVKLHLLSFRLHGPDESWNFAPGTKFANSAMQAIETVVDDATRGDDGRAVWFYETTVVYRTKTNPPPSPDETKFPQLVIVRRGPYDAINQKELPGTTTTKIESRSPTLDAKSLSGSSIATLVSIGIPRQLVEELSDYRRDVLHRDYTVPEEIIDAIQYASRFNPELRGAEYIKILNDLFASGELVYSHLE